jgi:hypothetical protein
MVRQLSHVGFGGAHHDELGWPESPAWPSSQHVSPTIACDDFGLLFRSALTHCASWSKPERLEVRKIEFQPEAAGLMTMLKADLRAAAMFSMLVSAAKATVAKSFIFDDVLKSAAGKYIYLDLSRSAKINVHKGTKH